MHELVLTPRFERAFRRLTAKSPGLPPQIEATLPRLAENLTGPGLKTHRLSGQLADLLAFLAAYDCRLFSPSVSNPRMVLKLCCTSKSAHEEVN